jgi:hypothetical protein
MVATMTERHTYWVSIGRNIADRPMSQTEWLEFQDLVREAVALANGETVTVVRGSSTWQEQEEETFLLLASVPATYVHVLRDRLAALAGAFDQDAIGFVGGSSDATLIYPT